MIKSIIGFTCDSLLIVWALVMLVFILLTSVLVLHLGGIISADPAVAIMDHFADGAIRWIAALLFP